MSMLPYHVELRLKTLGVHIERLGRTRRGAPTIRERRWFFCGWYFHRGTAKTISSGPYGPFPCWSAAAAEALRMAQEMQWRPDMRLLNSSERDLVQRTEADLYRKQG